MNFILRDRADPHDADAVDLDFRHRGLIGRVRLFFIRRRANALLRRALQPHRIGSARELSPHLLKDIGLPPDFRL